MKTNFIQWILWLGIPAKIEYHRNHIITINQRGVYRRWVPANSPQNRNGRRPRAGRIRRAARGNIRRGATQNIPQRPIVGQMRCLHWKQAVLPGQDAETM